MNPLTFPILIGITSGVVGGLILMASQTYSEAIRNKFNINPHANLLITSIIALFLLIVYSFVLFYFTS